MSASARTPCQPVRARAHLRRKEKKKDPERLTDASSRHGTDQDNGTGSIAPHHVLGGFASAVEGALDVDSHELAEPVARVLGRDKVL